MRLERRLLLYGVALPSVLMAISLAGVGTLLWVQLIDGIDHSLRAQATAESVSLFDGPDGRPHFHAITSLRSVLGHPDAAIAIYDADGALLESSETRAPARLVPPSSTEPTVQTTAGCRELVLRVEGPGGTPHALWLSTPLDEEKATIWAYSRDAFLGLLAFVALLTLVQRRHARWLGRRVNALAAHMERLRSGDLTATPDEDPVPDVLGRLRDAVAEATQQLREAHRAREHFVAGAAHELRTPLTAMRASVDIALRRERSADELRAVLNDIHEEIDRLNSLATELLDLASVGARDPVMVETELTDLANESVRRFRAEAEAKEVSLDVTAKGATECRVVPDLVARALDNLISNALRYAPPQSRVHVQLASEGAERTVCVSDEGEGIANDELDTVFTPFHRLDRQGDGRGLGLALVREIAELHGGSARALAAEHGATIELRFPLT